MCHLTSTSRDLLRSSTALKRKVSVYLLCTTDVMAGGVPLCVVLVGIVISVVLGKATSANPVGQGSGALLGRVCPSWTFQVKRFGRIHCVCPYDFHCDGCSYACEDNWEKHRRCVQGFSPQCTTCSCLPGLSKTLWSRCVFLPLFTISGLFLCLPPPLPPSVCNMGWFLYLPAIAFFIYRSLCRFDSRPVLD